MDGGPSTTFYSSVDPVPIAPSTTHQGLVLQKGGGPDPTSTLLPLTHFHGPKTRRKSKTHHRSNQPQPTYPLPSLFLYQSSTSRLSDPSSSVLRLHRHPRCLYSRSLKAQPPQVPNIFVQSPTLQLQSPPVRPQCGSFHFLSHSQLATNISPRRRYSNNRLLRQSLAVALESGATPSPHIKDSRTPAKPGFRDKPKEIQPTTKHRNHLAGSQVVGTNWSVAVTSTKAAGNRRPGKFSPHCSSGNQKKMGRTSRTDKLRHTDSPKPKTSLQSAGFCHFFGESALQGYTSTPTYNFQIATSDVDEAGHMETHSILPQPISSPTDVVRCLIRGLGGDVGKQQNRLRTMEQRGNQSSHQCPGTPGSYSSNHPFQPSPSSAHHPHRQFNSPKSVNQILHKVQEFAPITSPTESHLRDTQFPAISTTYTFDAQCGGRRAQPSTSTTNRVEATTDSVQRTVRMGRALQHRSNGDTNQHSPATLHLPFSPPTSADQQRSQHRLAHSREILHVPSHQYDPSPSSQSCKGFGLRRPGCSMGSPGSVVSSPSAVISGSSLTQNHSIPGYRSGESVSQVGDIRQLDRISFLRKHLYKTHSQAVADTIIAGFRDSSLKQQEVAWRAFQRWLPQDTVEVTLTTVLQSLFTLFTDTELTPSTINSYKSSLSWPLNLAFGIDFNHKDLSLFIRGLFHRRPPIKAATPTWNLGAVLTALQQQEGAQQPIQFFKFFKALILTALASGNRVSELAALNRTGIITQGNSITIPVRPHFLFKNQTLQRHPPAVSFPGLPGQGLCSINAIQEYLTDTATTPHENRLFLNPKSKKALSSDRLAYWLVQGIKARDPSTHSCAHDFRKWAFSVRWARRQQVVDILQSGFWTSAHPFLRHYLMQIQDPLPHFVAAGTTD